MSKKPFVTVIMPVRNEAGFIADSIRSVLAQDYPLERMEILIADGMSDDGTREIIKLYSEQHPNIRLIDNRGQIVPTGMNAALRQSKGDIIVRIDGHCEPARDYVSCVVEHLLTDQVEGVGGPIETVGETNGAKVIALAMSSPFGVGGSAFRTVKDRAMLTDTVAFPAYTREVVERLGQYDEELVRNQDDEYNYRLRKSGGKVMLTPDIRSRYYSRSSLTSTWSQYFQYGYWKVRVMQKHPAQMRARQFLPPLFVFALLITSVVAPFSRIGLWAFLTVAGFYLIASLLASALTAARAGSWQALLLLPAAFAALHVSYGLGFLYGLIVFRSRWRESEQPVRVELPVREAERV